MKITRGDIFLAKEDVLLVTWDYSFDDISLFNITQNKKIYISSNSLFDVADRLKEIYNIEGFQLDYVYFLKGFKIKFDDGINFESNKDSQIFKYDFNELEYMSYFTY